MGLAVTVWLYLPSWVSGHPSVSLSDGRVPLWKVMLALSVCPSPCFRSISLSLLGSVYIDTSVICLICPPVPPQNLGPSILAGVALMVLLIPINGVVAMKMRTLQVGTGQVLGRAFTSRGPLGYFVYSLWMATSRCHKP